MDGQARLQLTHFDKGIEDGYHVLGTNESPESSYSVAEEVTNLMICAMVRIGPLTFGTGASSKRNMQ